MSQKFNLILSGFMGTGKSTLGPMIADRLGYSFVDLDKSIEAQEKQTIVSLFAEKGEPYFRKIESSVLKKVLSHFSQVVALGGGTLLSEENRKIIDQCGKVLCLCASLETLKHRLSEDRDRPLIQGKNGEVQFLDLYHKRKSLYDQISWKFYTDHCSLEESVEEICLQWNTFVLKSN